MVTLLLGSGSLTRVYQKFHKRHATALTLVPSAFEFASASGRREVTGVNARFLTN